MNITYEKIRFGDNWYVLNLEHVNYVNDTEELIITYSRHFDRIQITDHNLEDHRTIKDVSHIDIHTHEWEAWSFQFTTVSAIDTDWLRDRLLELEYILKNLPY